MANTILLITEDENIVRTVRAAADELNAALEHIETLKDAESTLDERPPDLVLCDYSTFDRLHRRWPRICTLLYADPADSDQAIEAIKRGAIDFLIRPIEQRRLTDHVRDALRISRDIHVPDMYEERSADRAVDSIVGQSVAMKEVYKLIGRIAPRDINVLITGESGTGKELVARAILHHSPRREQPFLAVNCAAIPETLLESELFGHEKGAFTGAEARRIGKFEQCDGGTLFLDEIGDIPPATQAKLLRVLQEGTFQRLGGAGVIHTDVRIIAATHQPIGQMIAARQFREDLYYRINVASIHLPPLREREIDVIILAHYFVGRLNQSFGTQVRTFAPETLPLLLQYPWPGNVRELENAMKAALVVARGAVLRPEFLPENIRRGTPAGRSAAGTSASSPVDESEPPPSLASFASALAARSSLDGKLHRTAMTMIEREIIVAALDRCRGRASTAAKVLGISRTTLRKKMAEFGIHVEAGLRIDHATEAGH